MSKTKSKRDRQSQLGQFFTPESIASNMIDSLALTADSVVLEPSSGDGSFLVPLIKKFMRFHTGSNLEKFEKTLVKNIFAVELDTVAFTNSIIRLEKEFGKLPKNHHIVNADFFKVDFENKKFNFIIGNPPFGGTIESKIQDLLDNKYGERDGLKIKKETYSFFTVACVEMLAQDGKLLFICSDTFLTISTMKGLREFLLNRGDIVIKKLAEFSDETEYPMVIIDFSLNEKSDSVIINGSKIDRKIIDLTGNKSWQISDEFSPFFSGKKLGDFIVASSGMTIGQNKLFLRKINNNSIVEPYSFEFFQDPITLDKETSKARLNKLSESKINSIKQQEKNGETKRNICVSLLEEPKCINLPSEDYCLYNKSSSDLVYTKPKYVVYWRDDGDAVITFKKNGNWYLHGVGGRSFFKKEGLTWQLISQYLNVRYLPPGYILDSGCPCAILQDGIDKEELWFILGWTLTPLCNRILKEVINHTRNIQSKDFEKLPYPFWVGENEKIKAIAYVKKLVESAMKNNKNYTKASKKIINLSSFYDYK